MSRWEKLIARLLSMDADLRFDELRRILEYYGYKMHMPKGGGSHCVFRRRGRYPITIPRHEPIKRVYIEMVRDIVEEELSHEND